MTSMIRTLLAGAMLTGAGLVATGLADAQDKAPAPELAFQLTEGQNLNAFVRDRAVAAHLLDRKSVV